MKPRFFEPLAPKFRVGVLGATGTVGQRFVSLLDKHPWMEVVALGASERSAGQPYSEVCPWIFATDIPAGVAGMVVLDVTRDLTKFIEKCDIVFSALSSGVAKLIEEELALAGIAVFSNSAANRYESDVPICVPFVNPQHLELARVQKAYKKENGGFIVTNANCSATGLCVLLKAIDVALGVEQVFVCTLQAVSGAGFPGPSWRQIDRNVVPFIANEETKLQTEPGKILGELVYTNSETDEGHIAPSPMRISAMVHRVPVEDGHTISVSVKLRDAGDRKDVVQRVIACLNTYNDQARELYRDLPSAPSKVFNIFVHREDAPQPKLHSDLGGGMTVSVGRIRPCDLFDFKCTILCNNTVLGAAGASVLNAELAIKTGLLR